MPRPVGESPDDFETKEVSAIKDGEPVSENADRLSKLDLRNISEDLEYENFEGRLASEAAEQLAYWGVEVEPDEIHINVASSEEDISHLQEYDLEVEKNAAYVPQEDEVVLFAFNRGKMGTSSSNAYSSTVHEFKHHEQDEKFDEVDPAVRESSTQLINLYLDDKLERRTLRKEEIRKIRSSNYTHNEEIAEELKLATKVYDNLREAGKSRDEAMNFLLNDYEERRWNLEELG
jgi:hypothetical protein